MLYCSDQGLKSRFHNLGICMQLLEYEGNKADMLRQWRSLVFYLFQIVALYLLFERIKTSKKKARGPYFKKNQCIFKNRC